MNATRVLIVDDSVVARRVVREALEGCRSIEVVGTAATGQAALAEIGRLSPDVVVLDVELPDMSGLEVLARLRRDFPVVEAIMFSALGKGQAEATVEALRLGAADFVTKPSTMGSVGAAIRDVRTSLVDRIVAIRRTGEENRSRSPVAKSPPRRGTGPAPSVLVIGSSTGGPAALARLFGALSAPLPIPVVVVQHLPVAFTKVLADRLGQTSEHRVSEAVDGAQLAPGQVWIAPGGGRHTLVESGAAGPRLALREGPRENSCRPAVDVLFRSAANSCGARTLAAVLTGMGRDGLEGCRCVAASGGRVVVQDQDTSVVWGMPRQVYEAGLADEVLSIDDLALFVGRQATGLVGAAR